MKKFFIEDNLFRRWILFIYDCSEQKMLDAIKRIHKLNIKPLGADGAHFSLTNQENKRFNIIWIGKNNNDEDFYSILVHEIAHCSLSILEDSAIKINGETTEILAYHQEMLFRLINNKIKKGKKCTTHKKGGQLATKN